MSYKNILIVSTSTVHGKGYLEYIDTEIKNFFEGCKNIAFGHNSGRLLDLKKLYSVNVKVVSTLKAPN